MQLNIEHRTRFAFDAPVEYTIQQLHLTPQDGFGQRVKHWEIRVNGNMQSQCDAYGNLAHTLVIDGRHSMIDIVAMGEVETGLDVPPPQEVLPLQVYLRATKLTAMDARLMEFAQLFGQPDHGLEKIELQALMHAVRNRVVLCRGLPELRATATDAFFIGTGSNQDQVHCFIACCRYLGVPARYVSGYLFNAGDEMIGNHAWADAWVDGSWQSFDVTHGQLTNGVHVRLATGLDERDARPISLMRTDADASTTFRVQALGMQQSQQ